MPKKKKATKKGKKASCNRAPSKAQIGFSWINRVYRIEREIKDLSAGEKYRARQARTKPELESLKAWLLENQNKVLPSSLSHAAISYTLNQWDRLVRFIEDGHTPISNILAENAIRPFCVGRRNWLFSDTPKGAKASAVYYSLIETAKANGLQPYEYLCHVIKALRCCGMLIR